MFLSLELWSPTAELGPAVYGFVSKIEEK